MNILSFSIRKWSFHSASNFRFEYSYHYVYYYAPVDRWKKKEEGENVEKKNLLISSAFGCFISYIVCQVCRLLIVFIFLVYVFLLIFLFGILLCLFYFIWCLYWNRRQPNGEPYKNLDCLSIYVKKTMQKLEHLCWIFFILLAAVFQVQTRRFYAIKHNTFRHILYHALNWMYLLMSVWLTNDSEVDSSIKYPKRLQLTNHVVKL